MAFPVGWTRKCEIIIPASSVGTGGVTDFTFVLTHDNVPSEMLDADGSYPCNTDGSDIRVATSSDGTGLLTVDVITITLDNNPGNSVLLLRCGTTALSATVDNSVWIFYNYSEALEQTGSGAYSSDWVGYWPIQENTGTTITDRLGVHDGAMQNMDAGSDWVSGNGAYPYSLDFRGTASDKEHILVGDYSEYTFSNGSSDTPFSLLTWVNADTIDSGALGASIITKYSNYSPFNGEYMIAFFISSFGGNYGDELFFQILNNAPTSRIQVESASSVSEDTWYFVCTTYSGSESESGIHAYLNGSNISLNTAAHSYSGMSNRAAPLIFGSGLTDADNYYSYLQGQMAAPAIIGAELSQAWITTEYNQTSNPSTFASYGIPENVATLNRFFIRNTEGMSGGMSDGMSGGMNG